MPVQPFPPFPREVGVFSATLPLSSLLFELLFSEGKVVPFPLFFILRPPLRTKAYWPPCFRVAFAMKAVILRATTTPPSIFDLIPHPASFTCSVG